MVGRMALYLSSYLSPMRLRISTISIRCVQRCCGAEDGRDGVKKLTFGVGGNSVLPPRHKMYALLRHAAG
jgi:hypothetical protein